MKQDRGSWLAWLVAIVGVPVLILWQCVLMIGSWFANLFGWGSK